MDNNKIVYWVVGIIVCIGALFGLNMFLNRSADTMDAEDRLSQQGEVISIDNLVVPDQGAGSAVFVEKALLKTSGNGGFVVIYKTKTDGTRGEVVGVSPYLEPGVTENIRIPLYEGKTVDVGESVIAVLHTDNGDKVWNDVSTDTPIVNASGDEVMWKFSILAEEDLPGFEKKL